MQRPMAFPPHPRRWWKTPPFVVLGLLTALACSVVSAEGRYAFLVGVENYDPTELPSLTYAEDDIEAIGQALEKLGFNIVSMTSNASLPARKPVLSSDIVDQLETFLALRNRDDTVFVAFSGHGVQLSSDKPDATGRKELYFRPERALCGEPDTLVPMSGIMESLKKCKAARKLLVVDACRSDLTAPNQQKGVQTTELPAATYPRPAVPEGMTTIFSCSPKEASFEMQKLGHSIFSTTSSNISVVRRRPAGTNKARPSLFYNWRRM